MILVSVILYVPVMTLLFLRKKTQPIRHRSPYLVFVSLFSSFSMIISLSIVLFLNIKENNINTFTCSFYVYNTNILHFILIVPYIFRASRLLNVFNLKINSGTQYKNKLRESYYLKVK